MPLNGLPTFYTMAFRHTLSKVSRSFYNPGIQVGVITTDVIIKQAQFNGPIIALIKLVHQLDIPAKRRPKRRLRVKVIILRDSLK